MNGPPVAPSGTVTFLFTDIEDSSRHLQDLGEDYTRLLDDHNLILRTGFARHGGFEVKTQGDSFFVAFASATSAVAAAMEGQRALAEHTWPQDRTLRVRMGLHTGPGEPVDGDYQGIAIHTAARIMSAAHGGQILASDETLELLDDLDISWLDLGHHRLRGLDDPVHLAQVDLDGTTFPPIKTLSARRDNLPERTTSIVGRGPETEQVLRLLDEERLVTLLGPGGTGKTTLAMEVGARSGRASVDGVWLVELAAVDDPARIWDEVAVATGVREQPTPTRPRDAIVLDRLAEQRMLVLFDNCEHLITATASVVERLLKHCADLRILATSREPLLVAGEAEFLLAPLACPEPGTTDPDVLERSDAVRLFIDRARQVKPSFALRADNSQAVVAITRGLDGIPLALELAAARVRMLSPSQIADGLSSRFRLLTSGPRTAAHRQRTLRALIDWSYDLLDPEEQLLLQRLSVFNGTFSIDAATLVCSRAGLDPDAIFDTLARLVQKSLVVAEDAGATVRYRLLETIGQYAHERLSETGESERFHIRHLNWSLSFAADASVRAITGDETGYWVAVLEADIANLRTAMTFALEVGRPADALALAACLYPFWSERWYIAEGYDWIERALAAVGDRPAAARALGSAFGSGLAVFLDELDRAVELAEVALRAAGEPGQIFGNEARSGALNTLGSVAIRRGDLTAARRWYEEGLEHAVDDHRSLVGFMSNLALVDLEEGKFEEARARASEGLRLAEEERIAMPVPMLHRRIGDAWFREGRLDEAAAAYRRAVDIARKSRSRRVVVHGLIALVQVAKAQGRGSETRALLQEAREAAQGTDDVHLIEDVEAEGPPTSAFR